MSVGHERIDHTITALFDHAAMESSVFGCSRAPTARANRTCSCTSRRAPSPRSARCFASRWSASTADLGNPQRHLRRMLEQATLPLPDGPHALDRLVAWTRSPSASATCSTVLEALAHEGDGEAAIPARKALVPRLPAVPGAGPRAGELPRRRRTSPSALEPNYRLDAYQRLQLWLALLERIEGCAGPVVLIDEAENLYRGGTTRAERRTALRSLSFYCSGTLPGACVVMAITPEALTAAARGGEELLDDVAEQKTVLPCEDAAMFRRRVARVAAMDVPALTSANRLTLAFKVRTTHESVRGRVPDPQWFAWIDQLVATDAPPRGLVRQVADRLERAWWARGGVTSRASHPPAADR
jgi:hypothetical protein